MADIDAAVRSLVGRQAEAWTALSRLFLRPPDEAVLDALRQADTVALWPLDPALDEWTGVGLQLIAASTEDALSVKDDYQRLFVGPDKLQAPPYESVHVGDEKLLYEEATFAVRDAYAEFGLQAPDREREPDDHVGLELEFMATLLQRAEEDSAQAGRYLSALDEFLTGHAGVWLPGFSQQVMENAHTDVWRGLGHLLAGSIVQGMRTFSGGGAGKVLS